MSAYTRLVVAVLALSALAGCVERELTITSEPSGALVYLSEVEVGRTPLTVPFTWYGDYEVILRREGYETLKTHTEIDAPLYDTFPIDFVSQALVPWTYHYRVSRHFELSPQTPIPDDVLIQNALELRESLTPTP